MTDERGTVHVPAASLAVLLLGPGVNISHRAVELIGDTGASIVWVGERGVRYYAHGRPLTHSARLLIAQAALVSNRKTRLAVARDMYMLRFPGEDTSKLTMQQLRGREGARIRAVYKDASKRTGVIWSGREYIPDDFAASNPVNMALSAAHACLYGLAHSIIVALGCSPGLGFVHTGHERSFVYDIADLYKAETTIPVAFDVASQNPSDIGSAARHAVRDAFSDGGIVERMVADIRTLLLKNYDDGKYFDIDDKADVVHLWDEKLGGVASSVSYGDDDDFRNEGIHEGIKLEEGYGVILEDI